MERPCDFCRGKDCGGKRDCDCASCTLVDECPRFPAPTVRITDKCTQACSHCCFSCSPKGTRMMAADTAGKVAAFCGLIGVRRVNMMGGEFFLNPDWETIARHFVLAGLRVGIVTSGDFVVDKTVVTALVRLSGEGRVLIRVSEDSWHHNRNVDRACAALASAGVAFVRQDSGQDTGRGMFDNPVVPLGRSEFDSGTLFSSMACWCSHPEHHVSFMIDEDGTVSRCPFGLFKVGNVADGEAARDGLIRTIKAMDKAFIPSCRTCARIHDDIERKKA